MCVLEREYFRGLGGNLDFTPPSRILGRRGEVYKKDANEDRSDDGGLFLRGGSCKSHSMSYNRVQLLRDEVGLPQRSGLERDFFKVNQRVRRSRVSIEQKKKQGKKGRKEKQAMIHA